MKWGGWVWWFQGVSFILILYTMSFCMSLYVYVLHMHVHTQLDGKWFFEVELLSQT